MAIFKEYPGNADFFRSGTGATLPDGTGDTTEDVSRPGNLGLGIADPTTLAAKLDVAGGAVLRPVTLTNFAANAVIGTAAATVDIASILIIPQTTQDITVSLPNPTKAQGGRILAILNSGTAALNVATPIGNQKIFAGALGLVFWSGAVWAPNKSSPYLTPLAIAAATTLQAVRHNFEILEYAGAAAINITVPNTLPVGFQASFTQAGAGALTFVGSGGMVVNNRWAATKTAGQWAKAHIEVRAANSCILSGDVI